MSNYMPNLKSILGWLSLFFLVMSPYGGIPGLPNNVTIGDLFWIALVLLCAYPSQSTTFKVPNIRTQHVFAAFGGYVFLILLFPLVGMLRFIAPFEWYLGDLRWAQLVIVLLVLFNSYHRADPHSLNRHAYLFISALAIAQLPFMYFQFKVAVLNDPPSALLQIWYPEGLGAHGNYGIHINRYSAGLRNPSAVGLLGFVSMVVGFYQKRGGHSVFLFLIGTLLVVSSGLRSVIILAPLTIIVISAYLILSTRKLRKTVVLKWVVCVGIGAILMPYVLANNIGRLEARLTSVVDLVSGQKSFEEISGRGGRRWSQPIEIATSDWSAIGTLVNSSHALSDLPAFDSYFVVLIAQAGPFILLPFLMLVSILIAKGLFLIKGGNDKGAIVLGVSLALLSASYTQNTMTATLARVLLIVAVLLVLRNGERYREVQVG